MVSAEEVARRSAETMWSTDTAVKSLGIELRSVGPGRAELAMVVRPDMVNGHDIAHGGLIATLADSAFAYACNSYGEVTVAAGFEVEFLETGRLGDELVATAVERARRGRSGIYDVTVRRGDAVVAEFRGRSRSLGRPISRDE
ncbi:hydroxyphenylacetyl-CoA thioesterase PaaI (plasmid) [Nocardioides sp. R1-1]|uniref:hydroxyphenylacetyl-CoA thioesterase PaaI n=1 Tax=Nocardioides sp. R1-1 TaxID=3383502 RepID=UPI0038D24C36